jgi:hypothetical protein
VNHKSSARATFYRENHDLPSLSKDVTKHKRNILALYKSRFEEPLKSEEYLEIRTTSEILPGREIHGLGEFDARNFRMAQDFDPRGSSKGIIARQVLRKEIMLMGVIVAPKFIITVEMQPSDEADLDAWYR